MDYHDQFEWIFLIVEQVAPNIVGSVFLVCVAFSSDYFGDRALHLATCLMITCIGFIILAAVDVANNIGETF